VLFTVDLMLRNSYTEWIGKRNFAADLCGQRRSQFCPSVAAVELPRAVVIFKEQDGIYRRSVPEGRYYSWHICLTHFHEGNCNNITFGAYYQCHTVSKRPAEVHLQVSSTIHSVTWNLLLCLIGATPCKRMRECSYCSEHSYPWH
jgi:hypothetical protein